MADKESIARSVESCCCNRVESVSKRSVLSFEKISLNARAVRRPGSAALDLAYTARGVFDGFWERHLAPWDVAAGSLLVSEAGGKVSDFTGKKFNHHGDEILATNGILHQQIIKNL